MANNFYIKPGENRAYISSSGNQANNASRIEFRTSDEVTIKAAIYELSNNLYLSTPNGSIYLGDGTASNLDLGAVGTAVDLNLLGGGTISSNGNTLNLGLTGDTVNLNVSDVSYLFPSLLARDNEVVKLTGNQTISGDKIFAGSLVSGTLSGSIASSGNLILRSTTHSTKGSITLDSNTTIGGDANISSRLLMPFRGTAGTDRIYAELSGVQANDVTNENSGAFIRFRTSTLEGYGVDIGAHRRPGGASALIIKTGLTIDPTESVRIDENKNMTIQGTVTASGQLVVLNNDARLSDTRDPKSHTHGNITNAGAIGSTTDQVVVTGTSGVLTTASRSGIDSRSTFPAASHTHGNITNAGAIGSTTNLPIITTTSGVLTTGSFGTTASTFCEGNDARLTNARTPVAHNLIDTTNHPVSGLTAGHFLKALTTTTYGFEAHGLTATSVGALPIGGGTLTGSLTVPRIALTMDASNTSAHRMTVYDSGTTTYGMMLWNTNGTSGDWSTMIFGPNQANRRISFGKITGSEFTTHQNVTEIAYFNLDNYSFNTTGSINTAGNILVDGGNIGQTAKSGTNQVGGDLVIASGRGTGSGAASSIKFQTPTVTTSGTTTQTLADRLTITSTGVTISGILQVDGSVQTINSTTVTIDDPVITLGGDTAPTSDDNRDRGFEFRWHNGTSAKLGFIGFDDSTGYLTYIPDATNTSEVFSGTLGTADLSSLKLSSGSGSKGVWSAANNYISTDSYSNNTWLRNTTNTWTFQGGSDADSWTKTFQIYAQPVGADGANDKLIELGQRTSNATSGDYKGVRIVNYTGSTLSNGYLEAGEFKATGITTMDKHLYFSTASLGTFDPPGGSGSDTATDVAIALPSASRIVGWADGYIRTLFGWTSYSTIEIGQASTSMINGINLRPGGSGTVSINSEGKTLSTIASGAKTANFISNTISSTANSSTASITKTGLEVLSTGTWNGSSAINRGLYVNTIGGTINYAAIFDGGSIGIGQTSPTSVLHIKNATPEVKLEAGSTTDSGTVRYNSTTKSIEFIFS